MSVRRWVVSVGDKQWLTDAGETTGEWALAAKLRARAAMQLADRYQGLSATVVGVSHEHLRWIP